MSQAYQQLVLDDDSKEMVIIINYKGLFSYKYLCHNDGVYSAPDAIFKEPWRPYYVRS